MPTPGPRALAIAVGIMTSGSKSLNEEGGIRIWESAPVEGLFVEQRKRRLETIERWEPPVW